MSKSKQPFQPPMRLAPPSELNAYVVYEHQLDALSQGSPASLLLNYSLFFFGVAATAAGTLVSLPADSNRAYYTFLIVLLLTAIAGAVRLGLWWALHRSAK